MPSSETTEDKLRAQLREGHRLADEEAKRRRQTTPFPKLNINTAELLEHVEALLDRARNEDSDEMGAVNWGDLGVTDIEYHLSILHPEDGPCCVVTVEEASPHSGLQQWLNMQLDDDRFPNTYIECEW